MPFSGAYPLSAKPPGEGIGFGHEFPIGQRTGRVVEVMVGDLVRL